MTAGVGHPRHDGSQPALKVLIMNTTSVSRPDTAIEIRALIHQWADAVRRHDRVGILAAHESHVVMFDVPPPMHIRGIEQYSRTWDAFDAWHRPGDPFDLQDLTIVAGDTAAVAWALIRCAGRGSAGRDETLDVRLTIGLQRSDGVWRIVHEHHSVPAAIC
jgi:uncharacterized protein (TIGR02246 family)